VTLTVPQIRQEECLHTADVWNAPNKLLKIEFKSRACSGVKEMRGLNPLFEFNRFGAIRENVIFI
jgi:hypothetical protein